MEKDEFYDSVIEMSQDIRYMREDIADLKIEVKESRKSNENRMLENEKRIANIERIQNLNTGKLAVVLLIIGAGIMGVFQVVLTIWDKIPK
jgi:regulator of replication initiation timing